MKKWIPYLGFPALALGVGMLSGKLSADGLERTRPLLEKIPVNLRPLCECTKNALSMSLDALIKLDADLANQGIAYDDVIDDMNRENHAELLRQIRLHPENAERYLNLLNVSKHLERIGDCATNIDEDVIYMVKGAIVRHRTGIDGEFKSRKTPPATSPR